MRQGETAIKRPLATRSRSGFAGMVGRGIGILIMASLSACAPSADVGDGSGSARSIDRTGDPVMARVDGSPIYRLDIRRAAEAQGLIGEDDPLEPGDPVFTNVLDDLIDQRLLALDAVRSGVADDPEAKRRLAAAQDRILGNYRVERHLAETVTEDSIRELYNAQRELAGRGEERLVRRIVVADQETALEIARRLGDEEDFDTLIETYATDEVLRDQSGDMGWVSRNMLNGAVASQAFSTPVGGRSAPFQVGETWQVLEVEDVRTPLSRSYEDVREDISRFMTYEAIETLMRELRDRADIERISAGDLPDAPSDGDPTGQDNAETDNSEDGSEP